jgi:asparagine synthase (glutamine-hydrolysing)
LTRDPFGFRRVYYTDDRGGSRICDLLGADRRLDQVAIDAHLCGYVTPDRTCFAAVRAVPPGHRLLRDRRIERVAVTPVRGDFGELLRGAIARALASAPRPLAVALSGGLDSAVILALVREREPDVEALVLAPQLPGYDESERALETARRLQVRVTVMEARADDYRDQLRAAIRAFETPLYNLHPVSKWLLACTARQRGVASLLGGDGIDQVVRRDVSADYLPLTSAAFEAAGIQFYAPFLDDALVAHLVGAAPDPQKRELRELAATLQVGTDLVTRPKVSRLVPPIDLSELVAHEQLVKLARMVGREIPTFTHDRERVRWATLALLVDTFEAWH